MFTLLKRELKSLILNPVVIALITILNIVPVIAFSFYMKTMQEQSAYAGFENMLSLLALFFAVVIPVVTVLSMVKDKKGGNEDFLYAMPVSKNAVVLSKIFAQATLFAIPTIVLAIFPLVFSIYGRVNFLQSYLGVLIFFAFELFIIAFSAMLALKTKKIWSALVIAYSTLMISFLFGILSGLVRLLPLGTGFDKITVSVLNELSIFKKLDVIAEELFDWTALVFFLIGAFVFIAIALIKVKKSILTAFMSLLMVLAIGVSTILLPFSVKCIDINKNNLYSSDSAIKEYLQSVDDEVTVYLIDPYTNEKSLYNIILRTIEAGKNINLKVINTAEDQEFLEKYGLEDQTQESLSYAMIVESDKRWRLINGDDYFYYYNTDKQRYLSASELQNEFTYYASILNQYYQYYDSLSDEAKSALDICEERLMSLQNNTVVCIQLENAFAEAVAYVTADMIPTVYFLTGHGEEGTTVNPYDFKASGKLPENADMIVINSPSEDYSQSEINTIIDYLDNEGKLYILIDESNYSMSNLMNFLSHYGLSVDASIISEGEGEKVSDIVNVSVNLDHEAFTEMSAEEVTFKGVSKITISENAKYKYSTMLSYKFTEGDDEEAKSVECPVAVSISDDDGKRLTLFTGATTFNVSGNGIGEEELDRVSACVTNVMQWNFEGFDSGITHSTPKLYQKSLYVANDSDIAKVVTVFIIVILLSVVAVVAYIVSAKLRSKRIINEKR